MARHSRRDERGAASLVQLVIVMPTLMLMSLLVVQFGLAFHARQVAEQAAQEGVASARRFDGTAEEGRAQALDLLSAIGPSTLKDRNVTVQRGATSASATVTGTVISVVPWVHLSVSETAEGPVERYVPPSREFTSSEGSGDGN
ncbi:MULTISPECIES: TadE/TadG family type IV pilus assembly protein [unclassified Nocardioides]|uniref:TadE/TadG family type IV pilus assembly protein n=1 Tax=unclassified Nocardioides TaxID=2615069 RepID=UPI0009F016C5|nr:MULTISPECIES: TadE/TadG family type IV pilus assembly protein [unclassified Nocardioides]GAW48032.1 TadE family protein [Nocardioides sp. PD653-B2]GAW53665.1 TadE family protein [Nocardioides sp. PD653]